MDLFLRLPSGVGEFPSLYNGVDGFLSLPFWVESFPTMQNNVVQFRMGGRIPYPTVCNGRISYAVGLADGFSILQNRMGRFPNLRNGLVWFLCL